MEKIFWIVLIIALFVIGLIFFFIELETEEIEFFGPISIIFLISGAILWFIVNSPTKIGTPEVFLFISILIVAIPILILLFTIFLIKKIKKISNKAPEISDTLVGMEAICVEEIDADKQGYVRYKSELWKATSDYHIKIGQKVKITTQDQLLLNVELFGPNDKLHCPNCGRQLDLISRFCSDCGIKL